MLDKGAYMPEYAHKTDAGMDIRCKEAFLLPGTDGGDIGSAIVDTGIHVEIPEGYVGFIKSKSGLNVKSGITSEGVIDCGYTGSIIVKLYNHTTENIWFNKGDKITISLIDGFSAVTGINFGALIGLLNNVSMITLPFSSNASTSFTLYNHE